MYELTRIATTPFLHLCRGFKSTSRRGARLTAHKQSKSLYPSKTSPLSHHHSIPPPSVSQQQSLQPSPTPRPGFLSIVRDGLAHGVGWAFGMRAVDALFGPRHMDISHSDPSESSQSSMDTSTGTSDMSSSTNNTSEFSNDPNKGEWSWGNDDTTNHDSNTGWDDFDLDL